MDAHQREDKLDFKQLFVWEPEGDRGVCLVHLLAAARIHTINAAVSSCVCICREERVDAGDREKYVLVV